MTAILHRALKSRYSPEFLLATLLTSLIMALHFYFYEHAGGLWRDEVNSVNIGLGAWAAITNDSFPVFFPLCIRLWDWLGWADWRLLGMLSGLSLTAVFWLATRWLGCSQPLWSLVLVGLNAWVIIYGSTLRAYGLGGTLIVLCFAATWRYLEQPGRKSSWLVLTACTVLSVQTLYHNCALVAAICAGGMVVAAGRRNYRAAAGVFLSGLAAAVTLLPYWCTISSIATSTVLHRDFFDAASALTCLDSLLAFPIPQYAWLWLGMAAWIIGLGVRHIITRRGDDRALFAAVTFVSGVFMYVWFLRAANYYVQPWYFMPLLALTGIILEISLPRLAGRCRSIFWGGALATSLISGIFAVKILDYRMTNVDTLANKIATQADPKDFVIVKNWTYGMTFGHYFDGACSWSTVPPMADLKTARFDLYAAQAKNTNAMKSLLENLEVTLQSGHKVWIVGNFTGWNQAYDPEHPVAIGWDELVGGQFNQQANDFLRQHCEAIQRLEPGTNQNVNFNERAALFLAQGWKTASEKSSR